VGSFSPGRERGHPDVGRECGGRERKVAKKEKKESLPFITSDRWIIFFPKNQRKQKIRCFWICTTTKAAFGQKHL